MESSAKFFELIILPKIIHTLIFKTPLYQHRITDKIEKTQQTQASGERGLRTLRGC